MSKAVNVLDKGYVILQDHMGNDLSVVNSARVSYDRKKDEIDEGDKKLIKFLAREGHTSPFRHATLQFEVYAPLMVARQWWKYITGSSHQDNNMSWNESSRRYITEETEIYVPGSGDWRSKPRNSKQGSGEVLSNISGMAWTSVLERHVDKSEQLYEDAMKNGIAPEQARLFLPAYGMYVRWYWTASLLGVTHFLQERLEDDAQKEIQDYAKAVYKLTADKYPLSVQELIK